MYNKKRNVIKTKGNSVVLINNTIALLLLSFSFFFSSSSYSLIADTNIHIDWPQSKKKKGLVQFFFFVLLLPQRFNYTRKNAILIFSFSLVSVCLIFIQVDIDRLCLMTTHIIIIEFEVQTSQTKATDKEIEFLVYIASR
jgi:hypothetical protein